MEGIAFIVIVFGGGMLFLLSKSEIGRAIADRIRGGAPAATDPALIEEIHQLRLEVSELHERMDFTERMLATRRESESLPGGGA